MTFSDSEFIHTLLYLLLLRIFHRENLNLYLKTAKPNWIKAIPTIQTNNAYYNKLLVFLRIHIHAILTQLLVIMLERTFNPFYIYYRKSKVEISKGSQWLDV
jgi:hypothetical protein